MDTWEVLRQCASVGTPLPRPLAPRDGIAALGRGLRDRRPDILKAERELFLRQPQQRLEPLVVRGERIALHYGRVPLHDSRIAFRNHRQQQRSQRLGLGRQVNGAGETARVTP